MSDSAPEAGEIEEVEQLLDGDAELSEQDEQEASQSPAAGPDGFPPSTPVADMAPEQQAAYWRHQAKKHEKAYKAFGQTSPEQVKAMAAQLAEIEDSQKTEQQRLADRLAAAEQRATQAEIGRARLVAAAAYNLPASLLEKLGGSTEDEIEASAEAIASELAEAVEAEVSRRLAGMPQRDAAAPSTPAPTRPVESLTPGGLPDTGDHVVDGNAFLRRMAGRNPY